jgi:homogentisate 1,2-dioxygenase
VRASAFPTLRSQCLRTVATALLVLLARLTDTPLCFAPAVKFGLYAEQLTATAFIAPRHENQKLWFYRMRPSVAHQGFTKLPANEDLESEFSPLNPKVSVCPSQVAWKPFNLPNDSTKVDFVDGLKTVAGSGSPMAKDGLAIHVSARLCATASFPPQPG